MHVTLELGTAVIYDQQQVAMRAAFQQRISLTVIAAAVSWLCFKQPRKWMQPQQQHVAQTVAL